MFAKYGTVPLHNLKQGLYTFKVAMKQLTRFGSSYKLLLEYENDKYIVWSSKEIAGTLEKILQDPWPELVDENHLEVIIISDDDSDVNDVDDIECPICRDVVVLIPFCENGHSFCLQCLRSDVMIRGRYIHNLFIEIPCMLCRNLILKHFYFYL